MFFHENRSTATEGFGAAPFALGRAGAHEGDALGSIVDGRTINVGSLGDALQKIEACLQASIGFTLFTLNLDHLTKLRRQQAFRSLYEQATYVTADGWPVAMLARRRNAAIRRTTGADLILPLCRMAARDGVPVFLFGTTRAILDTASAKLQKACPGLQIVGQDAPSADFDPSSEAARHAATRIAASGARLCFVALGAPKQEIFAIAAQKLCPKAGFLCIGASLDYLAGAQWRAPLLFQKLGLEWAWRLALSPHRLGLRYIRCALLFAELLVFRGRGC